jgi:ADP-ribose pyrophosphatase YjhB (NUDIX family)
MLMVVVAVVQQAERILMVQEAKPGVTGTWNLPGGRVEAGEGLVDAMLREVQEEAGIAVDLQGLLCADQVLASGSESEGRMRFVFLGTPRGNEPLKTLADEHSLRAAWFARAELDGLQLRNPHALEMLALAAQRPKLLPLSSVRARYSDIPPLKR